MGVMFINVSNHPSAHWGADQYQAAAQNGQVVDLSFPVVEPTADRKEICALAQDYYDQVCALAQGDSAGNHGNSPQDTTVMVSGEFTFTYHLVTLLLQGGYRVVSACSRRESVETTEPDGSVVKTARFTFVQFREY